MIVRERAHVNAAPEQIWAILGDPCRMSDWNPHCVSCEAGEDVLRAGLRCKATMHFGSGPARELDCEVIACKPEQSLTLRFSGEAAVGTDEYVDETYVLRAIEEGTKVLHEVNFSHAGLPWFLKALLKVIHLVGRPPGKSPLDGLKELAEDKSPERGKG